MTIRKGEAWGEPSTVMPDDVRVSSDAELAAVPAGARAIVTGGNVHAAIGRPAAPAVGSACIVAPIDALKCSVDADGEKMEMIAVSDVTVGTWWSCSGFAVVTNAGRTGSLDLAPRSHPNDGRAEVFVLDRSVPLSQRAIARRRARTGTHLPHPSMSVSHVTDIRLDRRRGQRLRIDGIAVPAWTSVHVTLLPDHLSIVF